MIRPALLGLLASVLFPTYGQSEVLVCEQLIDVRNGTLQVEILPGEGEEDQATATSVSFEGIDGTALAVRWTGIRGVDLAEAIGKSALPTASYRLRFTATTGVSLYSFWLGPAESESRPTALSPW